jgi:hypothetical protein
MEYGEMIVKAFDSLTPETQEIYAEASKYSLGEWKGLQRTLVTSAGAAAAAVPGVHVLALAADLTFLMNRMSVCSFGVGAIVGQGLGKGNLLEEEDFAMVLAKWSGVEGTDNAAIAKASADLVTKVGTKQASKILAKTMCQHTGVLIGQKMSGKVGAKIGAKFGAKIGGKLAGGWIPFAGAAISGGINLWFISATAREAQQWYETKAKL